MSGLLRSVAESNSTSPTLLNNLFGSTAMDELNCEPMAFGQLAFDGSSLDPMWFELV